MNKQIIFTSAVGQQIYQYSEGKTYVNSPAEAPEGVVLKTGPRGGKYYDEPTNKDSKKEPKKSAWELRDDAIERAKEEPFESLSGDYERQFDYGVKAFCKNCGKTRKPTKIKVGGATTYYQCSNCYSSRITPYDEESIEQQSDELAKTEPEKEEEKGTVVKWKPAKEGEVIKWMTPDEYADKTGGELDAWDTYLDDEEGKFLGMSVLAQKMMSGVEIEPLELWNDEEGLTQQQGRHRAYAAKLAGETKVPVVVKKK